LTTCPDLVEIPNRRLAIVEAVQSEMQSRQAIQRRQTGEYSIIRTQFGEGSVRTRELSGDQEDVRLVRQNDRNRRSDSRVIADLTCSPQLLNAAVQIAAQDCDTRCIDVHHVLQPRIWMTLQYGQLDVQMTPRLVQAATLSLPDRNTIMKEGSQVGVGRVSH
jgi:hypothetical protein